MKKNLFEWVRLRNWLIVVALIPILSSCLNTDPVETTPVSYVTFYHGSPDAGGLDIYLNSTKINSSTFAYGNFSGYASFSVGSNSFRFTPTGSTTGLVNATYNLEDGKFYSLFIADSLANLEAILVRDTAATLTSTGKSGIRVINLSPDSDVLRLDGTSTSTSKVITSGSLIFKAYTPFTEIDSDIYDFDIKKNDGTILASVSKMIISSGSFYTLVIKGFTTPPSGNTNALTLQQLVNQ